MKDWDTSDDDKREPAMYVEFALLLLLYVIIGIGAFTLIAAPASAQRTIEFPQSSSMLTFPICEGPRRQTCVVDGDTLWLDGEKIRILDIDAPEVSEPKCAYEADLGAKATTRLAELLSGGSIELQTSGGRDRDQYGRLLRLVYVNGRNVGDILISEGLARPYGNGRRPWC